jgi:hypothetical protein
MFQIGEVIDISKAFKPNQKDDEGNDLALGSIKCRPIGHRISGNVLHVWARPAYIGGRRIPLVGEQVLMFLGPVQDQTDGISKPSGYYYIAPVNATDDTVLHQLPGLFLRDKGSGGGGAGSIPSPGKSFPKTPKGNDQLQPFEGDDLYQSRFGSSIRFGSTVVGGDYSQKPTWQGSSNGDPITIIKVSKPSGGGKYSVEDVGKDAASIYLTTGQKLTNVKVGFSKNLDSQKIPTYSSPQLLLNSDRVVLNAAKDMVIVNGKEKVVLAGKKIQLQTNKYNVDFDDLLDFIKDFLTQCTDLSSAKAQYSTPAGPTAASTNTAQFNKLLNADFNTKFKTP